MADDVAPVASIVTLGKERLLVVKVDPQFDTTAGGFTLNIELKPNQIGGGGDCTVQDICLRCRSLVLAE